LCVCDFSLIYSTLHSMMLGCLMISIIFFFNHPATTEIYTLSLHDALPIYQPRSHPCRRRPLQGGTVRGRRRHLYARSPHRPRRIDRKSTRLNSSHLVISYAVFCLKKKNNQDTI